MPARPGVAESRLTTTGPGAANTLGAVGEAWAGRSPIVVLATDIPSTLRRQGVYRGALHEMVDQGAMFAPLVKKVMKVRSGCGRRRRAGGGPGRGREPAVASGLRRGPDGLPFRRSVFKSARGRDLSTDQGAPDRGAPTDLLLHELDAAVALLDKSERPLIWAGGGAVASGAGDGGRLAWPSV